MPYLDHRRARLARSPPQHDLLTAVGGALAGHRGLLQQPEADYDGSHRRRRAREPQRAASAGMPDGHGSRLHVSQSHPGDAGPEQAEYRRQAGHPPARQHAVTHDITQ